VIEKYAAMNPSASDEILARLEAAAAKAAAK
jgi:hypothetical protein